MAQRRSAGTPHQTSPALPLPGAAGAGPGVTCTWVIQRGMMPSGSTPGRFMAVSMARRAIWRG